MTKILVIGLNPAWQRVFSATTLQIGGVNRPHLSWALASGKGINAAKVLARMGHEVSVLQILAGENGRRCQEGCAKWKIKSLHVRTKGETRECITLLSEEEHSATEIIEPFAVTDPELTQQILMRVESNISYDAILICGSLPYGIPENIYEEILKRVNPAPVLWDSIVGLTPEILNTIAWMKVNEEEYARVSEMVNALDEKSRPKVLITHGANPARVLNTKAAGGTYSLPALKEKKNPIGAGDTVTAMLADGLLRGLKEEEAVRRALAFGMASCATALPADFNPVDAETYETHIQREAP